MTVVLVMPGSDGELGTIDYVERTDVTESPYFFGNLPAGLYEVYVDEATLPEFLTQTYDLDLFLDDPDDCRGLRRPDHRIRRLRLHRRGRRRAGQGGSRFDLCW